MIIIRAHQLTIPVTGTSAELNHRFLSDVNTLADGERLLHNHPSGDPTPSRADIDMTQQVVEAGRALGVAVHDHIIIGRDGQASLRALKLM